MTDFALEMQGALSELRDLAESLMLDTCRITRAGSGRGEWNGTGYDEVTPTTVYEGRCKVQSFAPYEQTPESAEQRLTVQRYFLHVPVDGTQYQSGDRAEMLTSAHNPALPGTVLTIAGAHDKSLQTSVRLLVDEVLPRG